MPSDQNIAKGFSRGPTPKRRRPARPGASAVELAISLPLLVLLTLGCVDFGRAMHEYIAVTNAARAGAEYGSTHNFTPHTQAAWEEHIHEAIEEELSGLNEFDAENLTVAISTTPESDGLFRVAVEARYPYSTTIRWPGAPHAFEMSRRVEMRRTQ